MQLTRQYSSRFSSLFKRNNTIKISTGVAAVGALGIGLRYYFSKKKEARKKSIENELKSRNLIQNDSQSNARSFIFKNETYKLYEVIKINDKEQLIIAIYKDSNNSDKSFFKTIDQATKEHKWFYNMKKTFSDLLLPITKSINQKFEFYTSPDIAQTPEERKELIEKELKKRGLLYDNSDLSFTITKKVKEIYKNGKKITVSLDKPQERTFTYHLYEIVKINNTTKLISFISKNDSLPYFNTVDTLTCTENYWYLDPQKRQFNTLIYTIRNESERYSTDQSKFEFKFPQSKPETQYITITN